MARAKTPDTEPVETETPPVEPWVEGGFRLLVNPVNGMLHRCPNRSAALGSFYGRGYVDAVRPEKAAAPAPSDDAWVEDGFRLLVHPETSGSSWVADRAECLQVLYANGWVDAEKPAPDDGTGVDLTSGWVDEDGFRVLTHPVTGGTTRVPNRAEAVAVWAESGWVDAEPPPPDESAPESAPAPADGDAPPITENPADTATTEKE